MKRKEERKAFNIRQENFASHPMQNIKNEEREVGGGERF